MPMKAVISLLLFASAGFACAMPNENLTKQERDVIWGKGTEAPFSGKYNDFFKDGIYVCKVCGAPLYPSEAKFRSGCGWPSFDDAFPRAVGRLPDPDGERTEIVCARCGAHLGHVFKGEKMTPKNIRHCVNSVSMDFIPAERIGRAYLAGGCFWGVEELMRRVKGVISCVSGYCGGRIENPSYSQVCNGNTGHLECVEVLFDTSKVSYGDILRAFFEIHDFTQRDGQGPDKGEQYKSAVFYCSPSQKAEAEKIIAGLRKMGYDVATRLEKFEKFYRAEDYHQRYYEMSGKRPYCHARRKIFD